MSFGVSAIGCVVFVLYVTKLFLRYKSREIGIFLALGAEKHTLKRSLAGELAQMTAVCSAIGILLGAVIAFTTGNIIEVLIADVYDGNFTFTASGLLLSVCYALVLFLFIQFWIYRCAESACPVFWKSPVRKEKITVPDR